MDWLWYLFGIIVTAGILFFKLRRKAQFKEKIPSIAKSLGLKYVDRADQLPELISADTNLPAALSDPEKVRKIQTYARVISIWKIEGEFNGIKVEIKPRRLNPKDNLGYTRVQAYFPQAKTLGLIISGMASTPLGIPEIKIETLNKKIIIKAVDESNTRQLLNDSDVQLAIDRAFEFSSNLVVDDNGTYLDKQGSPPLEADYYRQVLDHLSRIINAIENRLRFLNLS